MHVVLGDEPSAYRCADYLHYFQALLQRFLQAIDRLQTGARRLTPSLAAIATCAAGARMPGSA